MKHRQENGKCRGEGLLIAAVLGLLLLSCLFVYLHRLPGKENFEPVHAVSAEKLLRAEMVDINHAPADEIASLPGIGEELARRIAEYRAESGPFSAPEEIMNVPGIGKGKLEAILPHIYIQ